MGDYEDILAADPTQRARLRAAVINRLGNLAGQSVDRGNFRITVVDGPYLSDKTIELSIRVNRIDNGNDVTPNTLNPIRITNPPLLVPNPNGTIDLGDRGKFDFAPLQALLQVLRGSGLMATFVIYPDAGTGATTVDGHVGRSVAGAPEAWATIIAGAGNSTNEFATSNIVNITGGDTTNTWGLLRRSILTFDTSGMSGRPALEATLSLFGVSKTDGLSATPNVNIYGATPSANNDLANADYGQTGATAFSTAITYAGWSTSAYNDFALNANGLSAIDGSGITRLSFKNANYDVAASAPPWVNIALSEIQAAAADTSGTTSDPKLTVTSVPFTAAPVYYGPPKWDVGVPN